MKYTEMMVSMTDKQLLEIPRDELLSTYLHSLTSHFAAILGTFCTFTGLRLLGCVEKYVGVYDK